MVEKYVAGAITGAVAGLALAELLVRVYPLWDRGFMWFDGLGLAAKLCTAGAVGGWLLSRWWVNRV